MNLNRQRVVVAMSGGVDSSVAAALLAHQGYDVIGMMMRLWAEPGEDGPTNRCCTPEAVVDARRVAAQLGIPFYVISMERPFWEYVVEPFIDEYRQGRTPNPCIRCNRFIKFDLLIRRARALEADYLATGHYARVQRVNNTYHLLRGVDPEKDQSYMLYALDQIQLAHTLFPLGELTKEQVRAIATQLDLPVAQKEESQDLCFLRDGDYRRFLREQAPEAMQPGPIYDTAGRKIGTHQGIGAYTIGQRSGLGLSAPEPLYVIAIDAQNNALIVGPADELGRSALLAEQVHWIGTPPPAPIEVSAKIRYRAREIPATVIPMENSQALVRFDRPLRDITPGQAVVFYQAERVLGGGTIAAAIKE